MRQIDNMLHAAHQRDWSGLKIISSINNIYLFHIYAYISFSSAHKHLIMTHKSSGDCNGFLSTHSYVPPERSLMSKVPGHLKVIFCHRHLSVSSCGIWPIWYSREKETDWFIYLQIPFCPRCVQGTVSWYVFFQTLVLCHKSTENTVRFYEEPPLVRMP